METRKKKQRKPGSSTLAYTNPEAFPEELKVKPPRSSPIARLHENNVRKTLVDVSWGFLIWRAREMAALCRGWGSVGAGEESLGEKEREVVLGRRRERGGLPEKIRSPETEAAAAACRRRRQRRRPWLRLTCEAPLAREKGGAAENSYLTLLASSSEETRIRYWLPRAWPI
jgi:hypothetical protein